MKQTLLFVVLVMGMCSINTSAQSNKTVKKKTQVKSTTKAVGKVSKELMKEDDGFEWYKIEKDKLFGAESKDGKILVPVGNRIVRYFAKCFEVKNNGDVGIYSLDGKCIIPFSRHYGDVSCIASKSTVGAYYQFKKGSALVFCDDEGQEICQIEGYGLINPKYINGKFFFQAWIGNDDWVILDGNGNQVFGPANYFDIRGNGDVYVKSKKIGNLSSISTTINPFAKVVRRGITYTSSSSSSSFSSSSSSSNNNSGNKTTTVVVEHHRDPIPVQEWQTCTNCWGEGKVMCLGACGGTGTYYVGDRLRVCSSCNGTGKKICPYCSGQGGKNVTVYR